MKRWFYALVLSVWLFCMIVPAAAQVSQERVLARVDLHAAPEALGLPVYAVFQDAGGQAYALVMASPGELARSGVTYRALDVAPEPSSYLVLLPRRPKTRERAAQLVTVLYDDGQRLIVRASLEQADALASLGCDLAWLPETPLVQARYVPARAVSAMPDPAVAQMVGQVQENTLYDYVAQLSGETPALIGGSPYTITTRHTASGTPLQMATQFAYEHFEALGLDVSYHNWTYGSYSNRNVVAEMPGVEAPGEIVLVTAHIDDMPSGSVAPGADDNGSGTAGVLMAADIMQNYAFSRTVRFVLFTGEEQGLLGSSRYAAAVYAAGDSIVGVYNMDMIAWDSDSAPTLRIHTRTTSNSGYPGDLAIAGTFTNVVSAYDLSDELTPILDPDGITASDHSPFWNKGYPAVLAIEDDVSDFNSHYHTTDDLLSSLNMTYFTYYVKASVGTVAHMAVPYGDVSRLTGVVTASAGGAPLPGVRVLARSADHTYATATDANGAYSLAMVEGVYTVTAQTLGYQPDAVIDLTVSVGAQLQHDFVLQAASPYALTGTVSATAGWPLYAYITVDADLLGLPVEVAKGWTDPLTGAYTFTLPGSLTYALDVSAWLPGYVDASRELAPLTSPTQEDFTLAPDAACIAGGYTAQLVISETFESADGGYAHSGTGDEWEWGAPVGWPDGCASGDSCWGIDLDDTYDNTTSQVLLSPVLDFSALPSGSRLSLSWQQAWDIEPLYDQAYAEVSVNGGPWTVMWSHTGAGLLVDWTAMHYDLSAAAGGEAQLRWRLVSDDATTYAGYYIDDVTVLAPCAPQSGGLVVGDVLDANTGEPIPGATVSTDQGSAIVSGDAPAAGFYALFAPTGTHTLTVTLAQYTSATATVTLADGDVLSQDILLSAGMLAFDVPALEVALALGMTRTLPVTFSNVGTWSALWQTVDPASVDWLSVLTGSGELAPGESDVLTVTLDSAGVQRAGIYVTALALQSTAPYPQPKLPVTLSVSAPDLSATLGAPSQALAGDTVTVTVTYANTGSITATTTALTVTLPAGLSSPDPLVWEPGDLAPGASGSYVFTATLEPTLPADTPLSLQAEITSASAEFVTGNNTSVHTLTVAEAPAAGFTTSAPDWLSQTTIFTNTTSGTLPITYHWAFGDGMTSTLADPTHVYTAAGLYTATLEASNSLGTDVASQAVTVTLPPPPTAMFTVASPVYVDRSVVFTNTSTGFGDLSYVWDFGDGVMSALETPTHVYTVSGSYSVTLAVANLGGTDVATVPLEVRLTAPVAGFVSSAPHPLGWITYFTNTTAGREVAYQWDFGDDSPIVATEHPTHTYAAMGTYTVVLTATNAAGTDVAAGTVSVASADCVPAYGIAFTYAPLTPTLGTLALGVQVAFTATAQGTSPIDFTWDFEGTPAAGAAVTHTYTLSGTHTVTLTVENPCALRVVTGTLDVVAVPPWALHRVFLPLVLRSGGE